MKNYSPVYTVLATMAVAAMAIGAEPVWQNSKQSVLSKSEAVKSEAVQSGYELVVENAGSSLPSRRILILQGKDFEAEISANAAVAIGIAKARKRTS